MPTMPLNQRRADALRPRRIAYDIRDRDLRGFGIRGRLSGRRIWFVHVRCDGERIWRAVGDAGAVAASEVNRRYYRNRIPPGSRGRPVAGITRRDMRAWFVSPDAVLATADRRLPILSVIMRRTEARGLRPEGSNPCRGIRRHRLRGRRRFLSDGELRRLSVAPAEHGGGLPLHEAAVRLLILPELPPAPLSEEEERGPTQPTPTPTEPPTGPPGSATTWPCCRTRAAASTRRCPRRCWR